MEDLLVCICNQEILFEKKRWWFGEAIKYTKVYQKGVVYHSGVDDCINGKDETNDIVIKPLPTRRELLKAVSTIRKYIDCWNDFLMHALLESFTRPLHFEEMKDSTMDNFP